MVEEAAEEALAEAAAASTAVVAALQDEKAALTREAGAYTRSLQSST